MAADQPEVEFINTGIDDEPGSPNSSPVTGDDGPSWLTFAGLCLIVAVLALTVSVGEDAEDVRDQPDRLDEASVVQSVPRPLLAAELFVASPGASRLGDLFDAAGGFEGLKVASAQGSFDLVQFDPLNEHKLLASHRSSYGRAQNQLTTEIWNVAGDQVDQDLWNPTVQHDFANFNTDGTTTMWVHGGGDGFAPRVARTWTEAEGFGSPSLPIYPSRFAVDSGVVFALTGSGDYYANEAGFVELVAVTEFETEVLADGSRFEWIDNPVPGLLVAYPSSPDGLTEVWDTRSLEPLADHPLAGRSYKRVAVSADERVAIGATPNGPLEVVSLVTGEIVGQFGEVHTDGIDRPVTLNHDGTVAITVEADGLVSIWWVGNNTPVVSASAAAVQPRWLSERFAPRSASAVSPEGTRIALRIPARADAPTRWDIIDTDVESWIERACVLAARPLLPAEISALGLADTQRACVD